MPGGLVLPYEEVSAGMIAGLAVPVRGAVARVAHVQKLLLMVSRDSVAGSWSDSRMYILV
jgi:hypothetical protein